MRIVEKHFPTVTVADRKKSARNVHKDLDNLNGVGFFCKKMRQHRPQLAIFNPNKEEAFVVCCFFSCFKIYVH